MHKVAKAINYISMCFRLRMYVWTRVCVYVCRVEYIRPERRLVLADACALLKRANANPTHLDFQSQVLGAHSAARRIRPSLPKQYLHTATAVECLFSADSENVFNWNRLDSLLKPETVCVCVRVCVGMWFTPHSAQFSSFHNSVSHFRSQQARIRKREDLQTPTKAPNRYGHKQTSHFSAPRTLLTRCALHQHQHSTAHKHNQSAHWARHYRQLALDARLGDLHKGFRIEHQHSISSSYPKTNWVLRFQRNKSDSGEWNWILVKWWYYARTQTKPCVKCDKLAVIMITYTHTSVMVT